MKFRVHRSPCHPSHQPPLFSFRVLSTCGVSFKYLKRHLWLRVWNPRRLAPNSQSWFSPLVQTLRPLPRSVLGTFPLQWFKNSAYPQPIANCAATSTFYIARSYIISTSHRMSFKIKYILCIQTFLTIRHITHEQLIKFYGSHTKQNSPLNQHEIHTTQIFHTIN